MVQYLNNRSSFLTSSEQTLSFPVTGLELAVASSSSSSSSTTSSASSSSSSSLSNMHSNTNYQQNFICIVKDLTDASNTGRRQVINLSGTCDIEQLILEAANFYSYDPYSFNLMWKCNNDMINICDIQTNSLTLADFGLSSVSKNFFEIHEKEGPPKRLKIDDNQNNTDEGGNLVDDLYDIIPINYTSQNQYKYSQRNNSSSSSSSNRRNATPSLYMSDDQQQSQVEYGPVNNPNNLIDYSSSSQIGYYPSSAYNQSTLQSANSSSYFGDEDTGYVGLINQAMTCYLNSLLQTLYMTPEFRNGIYRWKYESINDDEDGKKNIPFQLQRLFLNLQTSNKKSIQTHDLTKSFGWNSDDAFQQHDVQELCRVMFDALEKKFKGTQQENLINELYQGKIKDYVKCLECNIESARVDVFLDVPLCIRPFGSDKTYESVEEALDAFVQPEILDENNKYYCDKCQRMCKAHKGLKFESFPYIISLQLKRFDFDYNTMSRFKLSNTVVFPEILNVKKYIEKTESEKSDNDEETPSEESLKLETSASELVSETDRTDNDTVMSDEQNNDDKLYDYELFSIMIHSGSATGGHYYAYIKCFETDQWYNFNDEKVTKLDRNDIKKAFGTSYSVYSSTTAYMLLYRQKQNQRNEKFIKVEEFHDHLKQLLEKEKHQQLEADKLKEYMDNVCKIKVILPSLPDRQLVNSDPNNNNIEKSNILGSGSVSSSSSSSNYELSNLNKKKEKTINIHKDLTLDQAKVEIIKDLDLTDYVKENNLKCRILKYDTYNDLIERSYKNESTCTVFEALGFTKYPYGLCWYLELLDADDKFIEYSANDFNIKVVNLNISTFETNEMFSLRLGADSNVLDLRDQISKKLNCDKNFIRMALEKPHSLYNYVYLNKSLQETLKSQNFGRVNKLFIEYEDETDFSKPFEHSKFYYALDAIMNMLQMVVYLPTEEQCETFVRKTQRHNSYLENQRNKVKSPEEDQSEMSLDQNETVSSVETKTNNEDVMELLLKVDQTTINNMVNTFDSEYLNPSKTSTSTSQLISEEHSINAEDDSSSISKMSFQQNDTDESDNKNKQDLKLIDNHFKSDDIEFSLDEGIDSYGSSLNSKLIDNTNFNLKLAEDQSKKSTNSMRDYLIIGMKNQDDVDENLNDVGDVDDDDDNETNLGDVVDRCSDDVADLDVNIDDADLNNLDENTINNTIKDNDSEQYNPNDFEPFSLFKNKNTSDENGDLIEKKTYYDGTDNTDELTIAVSKSFQRIKQRVTFSHEGPLYVDDLNNTEEDDKNRMNQDEQACLDTQNAIDSDRLPDYSEIDQYMMNSEQFNRQNNDQAETDTVKTNDNRFIKSNLIVNIELGTRTLEIRMDKRIDLNEFKNHIDEYLKIGVDNFRVFRMCPNDLECELTSYENQFSYLTQNTKFVIKLGPPLKYGEYVLPVYKLNKVKGTFSYLCDFMIVHGLTVFNHKELLKDDLKDECGLDVEVEKIRLRKKISKRPGAILLDNEVFGVDLFVNAMTELCIQILDEPEKKTSKTQTCVYLRHWKPDEYELGVLEEIIMEGNTYDLLLNEINKISDIAIDDIEVLKCKRDFPFKSPILDLHKDLAWKENYFLPMEKLEDGVCFFYRNKTLKLGVLSEEKRREMVKEDNLNFRPTFPLTSRKETGIKIHVENV